MERMPQPGEIYQHFKGNLYRIVTLAEHTESGEQLVIYQALYGDFQVYARPLSMFVGEVDREKYPDVQGKQRFTLIPAVGGVGMAVQPLQQDGETSGRPLRQEEAASGQPLQQDGETSGLPLQQEEGTSGGQAEQVVPVREPAAGNAGPKETAAEAQEDAFELDPRLLAFLEADSYEKKLEVYASLAGKADASILNTIAVSLDLELSGNTLEEQYDTLKNCLLMLEKYECNRLR